LITPHKVAESDGMMTFSCLWGEGEVAPVSKHYTMKAFSELGGTAPCIWDGG